MATIDDVDEDAGSQVSNELKIRKDQKDQQDQISATNAGSNAPHLKTRRLTKRESLMVPLSPTDISLQNSKSKNMFIARRLAGSESTQNLQLHQLPQRPPSRMEPRKPLCWQTAGVHLALALKPKTNTSKVTAPQEVIVNASSYIPLSRPSLIINAAKS